MKINSVHLVTMCQMESKKPQNKSVFSASPFQTISIGKLLFSKFSNYYYLFLSSSIYLSVYSSIHPSIIHPSIFPSIHPSTHAPIFKALFEYQKPAALLSVFNCCRLLANLYIHWLKIQAIVYELLLFWRVSRRRQKGLAIVKGFQKWQLHYVTGVRR